MRSLKRHLSLIIPLLAILFAIESVQIIIRVMESYEASLQNSYSIIVASSRELRADEITLRVSEFGSLNPIDAESIINKLSGEVSEENMQRLKGSLPYYYSLTLTQFPSQARLAQITSILQEIKDVRRVESFGKAHDRIYRLLLILRSVIFLFACTVFITGMLLMIKQIEVWCFEHSERMEILSLMGAGWWLRNGTLFGLGMVDSVIAAICVALAAMYLSVQSFIISLLKEIGISVSVFQSEFDFIVLLIAALVIANISVFIAITRISKQRQET